MKALQTQFDNKKLSNAVATPTCSSCCCCCCCLATSIASSSLLAQRIAREGEKHQVPNRHLYTVLAALFVPIVGILVYLGFWTINSLLRTCTEKTYQFTSYSGSDTYTVCTNPGASAIIPLLFIAPLLVLWFLYTRVHIAGSFARAAAVTALIAVAFTAEFFGGALLVMTGAGGLVYLFLVPLLVWWLTVWYHRHLGKGVDGRPPVTGSDQEQNASEQHEAHTTTSEEPPEQKPPAPSS